MRFYYLYERGDFLILPVYVSIPSREQKNILRTTTSERGTIDLIISMHIYRIFW